MTKTGAFKKPGRIKAMKTKRPGTGDVTSEEDGVAAPHVSCFSPSGTSKALRAEALQIKHA